MNIKNVLAPKLRFPDMLEKIRLNTELIHNKNNVIIKITHSYYKL